MKIFFLILGFLVSGCESPLPSLSTSAVSLSASKDLPQLNFIEQPGGDTPTDVSLEFTGSNLKKIKSLFVGSRSCSVTLVTDSTLICCLSGSVPHGIYQVSAVTNSGIRISFPKTKYYAGAKVYGREKLTDSGIQDTVSQVPRSLYVNSSGLHIISTYVVNSRGIIRYDDVTGNSKTIFDFNSGSTYFTSPYSLPNYDFNHNIGFSDICQAGEQYFVLDYKNNRILVFNGDPYVVGIEPQYVIGQSKFSHDRAYRALGTSASRLSTNILSRLRCTDSVLYVSDSANNRVLGFDLPITQNLKKASLVLGQINFSGKAANGGLWASATVLNFPSGLEIHGNHLFVSDRANSRILAFELPLTNGEAAVKVIGQASFTGFSSAATQTGLNQPIGLDVYDNKLYVSDAGNNRVLIYDVSDMTTFLSTGAAAVGVIGQGDYTSSSANRGATLPTANTLALPLGTRVHNGKLFVADYDNKRLLAFSSPVPALNENASQLMGQPDFVSNHVNLLASDKTNTPYESVAVAVSPTHVFTSGYDEGRILRFPRSATNYPSADIVLGRTDFTDTNKDTSTVPYLKGNQGLFYDPTDNSLIAYSGLCPAVSIWTSYPTATNQLPDIILGQNSTACANGISTKLLTSVNGVCRSGNHLFVADSKRILRFTYPLSTYMDADLVLGQSSFTANAANGGTGVVNSYSFGGLRGIYCDDDRLIAVDTTNHRVLVWNSIPTINNTPADVVIGQTSFDSSAKGTDLKSLSRPGDVDYKNGFLVIADADNRRILVYEGIPTENGAEADYQIGENYFDENRDKYFPGNKNRVDHFNEVRQLQFYDDDRLILSGNLRTLVIPFKKKE